MNDIQRNSQIDGAQAKLVDRSLSSMTSSVVMLVQRERYSGSEVERAYQRSG